MRDSNLAYQTNFSTAWRSPETHRSLSKTEPELRNHLADQAAEEAAVKGTLEKKVLALVPLQEIALSKEKPEYRAEDCQLIEILGANFEPRGWGITTTGQVVVPESILWEIIKREHEATPWSTEKLLKHLQKFIIGPKMALIVQTVE